MDSVLSFKRRHIGPSTNQLESMLKTIGLDSIDQLINETVPSGIKSDKPLNLPPALSENDVLSLLKKIASKNIVNKSYIGMGYYNTYTPSVILRNILENPGWYTQYTPYQAEISQGRLESLFNYQTLITDVTGMDIANASLLDEGTAAAEAMTMMLRVRSKDQIQQNKNSCFVSNACFPQTIDVLQSRASGLGIRLIIGDIKDLESHKNIIFGAIVQYPNDTGAIQSFEEIKKKSPDLLISVATDLMALTLIEAPGKLGADICFGSSQRFGVPMGFGGPHAAFFATKDEYKRQMPGRIIGLSKDKNGNSAYRMSLQTREQHIRRDKATSNICTAQALLANMAAMFAVYHGPKGLTEISTRIHTLTAQLHASLKSLGFKLNETYFDTITIFDLSDDLKETILNETHKHHVNFRTDSQNRISISIDETTTSIDIQTIIKLFATATNETVSKIDSVTSAGIPTSCKRKSTFLTHPVFNSYHSETTMMRYIKSLEDKDLSLNTSMIPLGSCTMKLNAATEMIPVTWPEFSQLHPFCPTSQSKGYQEIFNQLEKDLCEITGFSKVSLQPNSGAQGELAGLQVIKAYLDAQGQTQRNIALIPSSAHGTNPASAVIAGLSVVIVKCDAQGNIDLADLKLKVEKHKESLAALMITYPSTHGVFEEGIKSICDLIHSNGGQVYMDGANMNAQVGLTSPGIIGADVCHLNLHKTFCIPHGGGGPGVGPIAVAKHLAPYLPTHRFGNLESKANFTTASAPWGSANILLISYAYIRMMGSVGLKNATEYAILNANYIKARLKNYYTVLYTGKQGHVAHELIIDCREFKKSAKIEVEDIAKRLMDFGFHAPTMSWPVPGTLMIEPTESEDQRELDRFCDALIEIRNEINEIETGKASDSDNVLKEAPHTIRDISADDWKHSYTRKKAAFPLDYLETRKFWPSVARVDNAYGDRNLVCSCLPVEAFEEEAVTA